MQFLAILVIATGVAAIAGRRRSDWTDHARRGLAVAMAFAGVTHLLRPAPFVEHLPDWTPGRDVLVAITGVIEIALGIALVAPRHIRTAAGRAVAAYLIAVLPANVHVAVADVDIDGQPGGVWRWIRLPLQAVFIAWALWSTSRRTSTSTTPPSPAPTTDVSAAASLGTD